MISKMKIKNDGAVALLLVIMITALTVVSVVIVAMTNISDLMSSYHLSEAQQADVDLEACLEDAMFRLSSSTAASGTYYLNSVGANCYYEISSIISSGLKTVTSTASSTSGLGYWQDTVVVQVNVSSTPISIYSYKNSGISYSTFEFCGDSVCSEVETCSNCSADCGSCQVCGNGSVEGTEVCDDGPESCGDGIKQSGTFCNATCDGTYAVSEVCDYTGVECGGLGTQAMTSAVGCTKNPYCTITCGGCTSVCL